MRTSQITSSKTEHRKGATGYHRAPLGCRAMHFFKQSPVACRLHPVGTRSVPVRLLKGALRIHRPGSVGNVTTNTENISFGRVTPNQSHYDL